MSTANALPDLSALNDAERTALTLLAQGHTAKSIANLTGRSVGAVNERLREARRKTGVGSSRELARLLAAQENRDELIGVAPAADPAPDPAAPAATGRSWKGVTLMSVTVAGALVAIALAAQPVPQSAPATNDAADAAVMSNEPTARQMHDRVMAEKRDEAWASGAEMALGKWFAETPDVVGVATVTRVRCGDTTCEIVGTFARGVDGTALDRAMTAMQGKPFADAIAALGFTSQRGSFATSKGGDDSFAMFVARR